MPPLPNVPKHLYLHSHPRGLIRSSFFSKGETNARRSSSLLSEVIQQSERWRRTRTQKITLRSEVHLRSLKPSPFTTCCYIVAQSPGQMFSVLKVNLNHVVHGIMSRQLCVASDGKEIHDWESIMAEFDGWIWPRLSNSRDDGGCENWRAGTAQSKALRREENVFQRPWKGPV